VALGEWDKNTKIGTKKVKQIITSGRTRNMVMMWILTLYFVVSLLIIYKNRNFGGITHNCSGLQAGPLYQP
jgi:hypothetical protein